MGFLRLQLRTVLRRTVVSSWCNSCSQNRKKQFNIGEWKNAILAPAHNSVWSSLKSSSIVLFVRSFILLGKYQLGEISDTCPFRTLFHLCFSILLSQYKKKQKSTVLSIIHMPYVGSSCGNYFIFIPQTLKKPKSRKTKGLCFMTGQAQKWILSKWRNGSKLTYPVSHPWDALYLLSCATGWFSMERLWI